MENQRTTMHLYMYMTQSQHMIQVQDAKTSDEDDIARCYFEHTRSYGANKESTGVDPIMQFTHMRKKTSNTKGS